MAQQTALAAAISSTGATSLTVDDFLGFPASGAFTILIDSELLRVTAGNGTTSWTVSRGYAGTTAATHNDNTTVSLANTDGYADIADLLATMDVGSGSGDRRLLIADLLADARAQTDTDCARTFFRVPLVSTQDFYVDVIHPGHTSLVAAAGIPYTREGHALDIISVDSVAYRLLGGTTYTTLGAEGTDWELDPGYGSGVAGTVWPYEDVSLVYGGSIATWPVGRVRLTDAALGFPSIPDAVKRANIDAAREAYRQGPGGGPSQVGVNQFGTPMYVTGAPASYRNLVRQGSPYVKRSFRVT